MSDMTTDQCFNEMAEVLGFPDPHESVGYIAILEQVKKLKEENKTLKDANLSSLLSERALLKQIKELKEENKKLKKQKKNLVQISQRCRKREAESRRDDMIMKLQRQARERHQEEEEEKKPDNFLDFAYELGGPALLDAIDSLCAKV